VQIRVTSVEASTSADTRNLSRGERECKVREFVSGMRRAHLPFSDILRKLRGQSRFKAALFFLPRILLSNRHQLFLIKVCEVDMPFDVSAEGLVVRMRGGG
jgi:hypothetical protein